VSFTVPRFTTPMTTNVATGENTSPSIVDPATSALTLNLVTLRVRAAVSRQVFDRVGVAFDALVLSEMAEAVAAELDRLLIAGTGSNGEPTGLLSLAGVTATTYDDATPTAAEFITKVAACATTATSSRLLPPELLVMHPRRWFWYAAGSDTIGRDRSVLGVPVLLDANVPTNLGAGTDEDRVFVVRPSDFVLLEAPPAVAVDDAVSASTVGIHYTQWFAFSAGRYPAGVGIVSGTGMNAVAT
jgi:hypothetical protein